MDDVYAHTLGGFLTPSDIFYLQRKSPQSLRSNRLNPNLTIPEYVG